MSNNTIYQIDAFTDVPFRGNPAGVMIVDEEVTAEWMQNMATEMNLSETAYLINKQDHFLIRYFTPLHEVPLCGHATLASAHLLYEKGIVHASEPILFKAKAGDLEIRKENDWIIMNFPRYDLQKITPHPRLAELIGFEPLETWSSDYDWIIAMAPGESVVKSLQPAVHSLHKEGLGNLIVTAKAESGLADFVVRCFVPASGIPEDPVTGSAHCALTPFWAEKLGKTEMVSLQLSSRTGLLKVKLLDNQVEISGQAVMVFKADLLI
jgi:PhzF family phenazine biosynthesis protein